MAINGHYPFGFAPLITSLVRLLTNGSVCTSICWAPSGSDVGFMLWLQGKKDHVWSVTEDMGK
jgi:hypothetical protein